MWVAGSGVMVLGGTALGQQPSAPPPPPPAQVLPPPAVMPPVAAPPAANAAAPAAPPQLPGGPGSVNKLPKADGSASIVQSDKRYQIGPPGIAAFAGAAPTKDIIDLGAKNWIDEELKKSGCTSHTGNPVYLAGQKKWVASYRLKYKDIPLTETSSASLMLTSDGRVISGRWRNIPLRVDATKPTVTADAAIALAVKDFKSRTSAPAAKVVDKPGMQIWVDVKFDGYLSWSFTVQSDDPNNHHKARYHVSATRPDQILDVQNALADSYKGVVKGPAWLQTTASTASPVPLPGLTVKKSDGKAKTGPKGDFSLDGMGKVTLECALNSDGFTITPIKGTPLSKSMETDGSSAVELVFDAPDEYATAQVTTLYWAERTREMLGPLLDSRLLNLTTYINKEQSFNMLGNAYFDPNDISLNFYRAASFPSGAIYRNTAAPDIVPHEFGHAVDHSYGGMLDAGLSEGLGDCLAIFMTRQSQIGRDVLAPGRVYRDDAVALAYPSVSEQHDQGQTFGGFVWETIRLLRQSPSNLSEDDAYEVVKGLVFAVIVDNSNSIPSAVQFMFEADDDDQNLANGTPHSTAMTVAAASRSIPLPPQLPRLSLPAAGFVPPAAQFVLPAASAPGGIPSMSGMVSPRPLQGQKQDFIYYYR